MEPSNMRVLERCPTCNEPIKMIITGSFSKNSFRVPVTGNCSCKVKLIEEEEKRAAQQRIKDKKKELDKSRRNRNRFFERAGLQTLFDIDKQANACFDNWSRGINPKLRQESLDFCEDITFRISEGIGLTIMGAPFHGKSYALRCIYQYLRFNQNLAVAFFNQSDLLTAFKNTFNNSEVTEEQLYASLEKADVIIIDELGSGKLSADWGLPLLSKIVSNAQRLHIPIVCATRCNKAQLANHFTDPETKMDCISPCLFGKGPLFLADEHDFTDETSQKTRRLLRKRRQERDWQKLTPSA